MGGSARCGVRGTTCPCVVPVRRGARQGRGHHRDRSPHRGAGGCHRGLLAAPCDAREDRGEAPSSADGRQSRRCACFRSCSAACSGRSRGYGRTPSRSVTRWPTAPRSTTTMTSRWEKRQGRRAARRRGRASAQRARRDGAKGTLPSNLEEAAQRPRAAGSEPAAAPTAAEERNGSSCSSASIRYSSGSSSSSSSGCRGTSTSQVTVVIIPIVALTVMILTLNVVAPSSSDVRVFQATWCRSSPRSAAA